MAAKLKGGKTNEKLTNWIWLGISLLCALALWTLLSVLPATARSFPNIFVVFKQIGVMIQRRSLEGYFFFSYLCKCWICSWFCHCTSIGYSYGLV